MGWNFPMQINNCKRVSDFKSPYRDCQVSCEDWDTTTADDLKPISESLWALKTLTLCFPRDTPQLSMFIQTSVWLFFSVLNYSCSSISFFFLRTWKRGRIYGIKIQQYWTNRKEAETEWSWGTWGESSNPALSFRLAVPWDSLTQATAAGMCRPQQHFQQDKQPSQQSSSYANLEKCDILDWNNIKWQFCYCFSYHSALRYLFIVNQERKINIVLRTTEACDAGKHNSIYKAQRM